MPRFAHKVTDSLGAEAWQAMIAGWRARKTLRAVARDLAAIGVKVPERTIARRRSEWIAEENRKAAAREHAAHLVAAMKENNLAASEIVTALATDALVMMPDAFTSGDPTQVQRLNLEAEKLRLKSGELEVKRSQLALDREKFQGMKTNLAKIREKTAQIAGIAAETSGLPAEVRQRIREIYGLSQEAP